LIESLLDAGLATSDATPSGSPRFGMFETIREYAVEALAASEDEARALRSRHFAWCLLIAEGDDPRYWTRGTAWLRRVAPEHDNMRTAISHADATGDTDGRLRLVSALSEYLRNHGHIVEALRLLEQAVADGPAAEKAVHARVLAEAGMVILLTPERDRAEPLLLDALERFRALDDRIETGRTQMRLGILAYQRGEFDESLERFSDAHELLRAEDPYLAALSLAHVGSCHVALGDLVQARTQSHEAFSVFEALDDDRGVTVAGTVLADVLLTERDTPAAARAIRALLDAAVRLDSPEWIAYGLELAADLALQLDRARDSSVLIAAFDRELAALGVLPDEGRQRHAELSARLAAEHGLDPKAEPTIPIGDAVTLAIEVSVVGDLAAPAREERAG
jgi:tetratricopeptide (TPR) repeat protein